MGLPFLIADPAAADCADPDKLLIYITREDSCEIAAQKVETKEELWVLMQDYP